MFSELIQEVLPAVGTFSWDAFWLPIATWTLVAGCVLFVLRFVPDHQTRLHHDSRLALLAALPFGIVVNWLLPTSSAGTFALILPTIDVLSFGPEAVSSAAVSSSSATPIWIGVLTLIAGVAGLWRVLSLSLSALSLRRLLRGSSPISDPVTRQMAVELSRTLSVDRPVLIVRSSATPVPFVTGLRTATVVLPDIALDREQLRMVLLHELSHVANADVAAALFSRTVSAIFAIHPLAAWIDRSASYFREARCDHAVLGHVERRAYANTLFGFARPGRPLPAVAMTATPSQLRQRIEAMTRIPSTPVRLRGGRSIAAFLLVAVTLLTACTDSSTSAVAEDQNEPVAARTAEAEVDEMPTIVGGMEALTANIQYPPAAKSAALEGRVVVSFVVDTQGGVKNAEVVQSGGDAGFDEEALRVIRQTEFTPGKKGGELVDTQLSIPISFRLK